MIGILVIVTLSWILLYVFEKQSIFILGLLPNKKRFGQFIIGFLATAMLCIGVQVMESFLSSSHWFINENLTGSLVWKMFYWDLKSVLTEELVFRGAILFILIKKFGSSRAIILSAIAFGIYHWFTFGIFGEIIPMVLVFIGTGLMGYAWALAFAKTESMALSIGLHLGWNFTFNSVFSNGPFGNGILLSKGGEIISEWFTLIGFILVPILVLLLVKHCVHKRKRNLLLNIA
ncbi:CPBP family intramembrane glutamic endopeptidase [Aegicerativicinus sediminis]|uniref:CPBP family intramembrane glutamic endopeptidase n=1 Tax=Aegicerativicinus sediminis TaxID=2893202 RepID=UPI001E606AC9|nr:type II CAAX endopeptidase family protein [Aegicerativicinus sediminis]